MSLLPKEHGAYGQMALPLLTSLAVTGLRPLPAWLCLIVIAGFLLHEPSLVVMGLRGPRARWQVSRFAWLYIGVVAAMGVIAGLVVLVSMPRSALWTLLVPVMFAVALFAAAFRGREKTATAQVSAALAFSAVALPICASVGIPLRVGVLLSAAFAVQFGLTTLAVRVVVLRVRGGGDERATRRTRVLVYGIAAVTLMAVMAGVFARRVPGWVLLPFVPGIAAAVITAAWPPPATRLKRLGWTLAATSVVTAIALVAIGRAMV